MAQTFKRVCIKDYEAAGGIDEYGKTVEPVTYKRGVEYITSPEKNGFVTVYHGQYWRKAPIDAFAGEIEFTKVDQPMGKEIWKVASDIARAVGVYDGPSGLPYGYDRGWADACTAVADKLLDKSKE